MGTDGNVMAESPWQKTIKNSDDPLGVDTYIMLTTEDTSSPELSIKAV